MLAAATTVAGHGSRILTVTVNYAAMPKLMEEGAADEISSCDAPEAAVCISGLLYITLMMFHGQDLSADCPQLEPMGWKRVTLSCVVYWARYGIPDHALVPSFPLGLQLLSVPLLPPPRPVIWLYLAASLRSIHLCNPTFSVYFFFAGRPQPGHVL